MEQQLDLRLSEPSDTDVILAFITQMGFSPRSRATWDGLRMGAMTAWHDGELVGLIPFEPRVLQVSDADAISTLHQTCVAVHLDYRARGLGSRLQEALALARPHDARAFTVFREDPTSAAYRWYERCGFVRGMSIASFFVDVKAEDPHPSPLPEYRERGPETARVVLPGHVRREFADWLPIHPYAPRYRFHWLESEIGRVLLGVGRMHSTTERADVLYVEGDAVAMLRCAIDACMRHDWTPLRFPESRNVPEIAALGLPDRWPFDMLVKVVDPTLVLDTSSWRYAGIDFA